TDINFLPCGMVSWHLITRGIVNLRYVETFSSSSPTSTSSSLLSEEPEINLLTNTLLCDSISSSSPSQNHSKSRSSFFANNLTS
ncbi:hypothetical protein VIGAN_08133500, partial [Vigna angularis var. angularis]